MVNIVERVHFGVCQKFGQCCSILNAQACTSTVMRRRGMCSVSNYAYASFGKGWYGVLLEVENGPLSIVNISHL